MTQFGIGDSGDSGIEVSAIALGSWLTYSGGVSRDQTEECTRAAFEAGITFFDTANVYGRGAAERVWGEILSDYPRASYVLATKAYFAMSKTDRGLSKEQIRGHTRGFVGAIFLERESERSMSLPFGFNRDCVRKKFKLER